MGYTKVVKHVSKAKLADYDPEHDGGLDKVKAAARLKEIASELKDLQELMYATKQTALLAVFQGMDTAGKDGAINRVLSYVNVQSCKAAYFKVPTPEERARDFLWRVHAVVPGKGGVTLFNRSHYEDVLVVRVRSLVSKDVWEKRYEQINAFEQLLSDSGTVILKFFLHISKDEQEQRLLEREQDPSKAWKLSADDWRERELWDQYMDAYEAVLSRCSTESAPWHIVPANKKWFRDLAVADAIASALRPYRQKWNEELARIGSEAKQGLEAYRSEAGNKPQL